MGSIGKNDSNREMNLRAKPNVMYQLINHRACDKMKGHNNGHKSMNITKARVIEMVIIRNAFFSFLFMHFCTRL